MRGRCGSWRKGVLERAKQDDSRKMRPLGYQGRGAKSRLIVSDAKRCTENKEER